MGLVLGLIASLASGGDRDAARESTFTVRAFDAVTGARLQGLRTALADPAGHTVLARSRSGVLHPPGSLRVATRLFAFARGYHLATRDLASGSVRADVLLEPVTNPALLVLTGPGVERETFKVSVVADMGLGGEWPWNLVRDHYVFHHKGPRIPIAVSRGLEYSIVTTGQAGVVWPLNVGLLPGGTQRLHYEAPWIVRLRPHGLRELLGRARFEFLPDRTWRPVGISGARVDAWRWILNGPAWLSRVFPPASDTLDVTPRVAFHLWINDRGVPIYRYLAPPASGNSDDSVLDLRPPYRLVPIRRRPLLDGKPIPKGTLLASGKLDLRALADLEAIRQRIPACVFRAPDRTSPWPAPRLPDADWLTLWHPDLGLAHTAWTEATKTAAVGRAKPLACKTYPGLLHITAPAGTRITGTLYFFPVWHGAGGVSTTPPAGILRRRFKSARILTYRGLQPGRYGIECRVRFEKDPQAVAGARADEGKGRQAMKRRRGEFTVPSDGKETTFVLAID